MRIFRSFFYALAWRAFLVSTLFGAESDSLFDAKAAPTQLQTFRVDGLKNPACGTVYAANSLSQGGAPLGGLGTGYITFNPDGRLGRMTALNAITYGNSPFFRLTLDGKTYSVATPIQDPDGENCLASSVDYFGHFPIVDWRANLNAPLKFECRAFYPMIPGDYEASNTPVAFFDVDLTNDSAQTQNVQLVFGPAGFPVGEIENYQEGEWSIFQTTHGAANLPEGALQNYALGVCGEGGRTESGVAIFEGALQPNEKRRVSFIIAWREPYYRESSGRVETNVYATRFKDAKDVAARSILRKEDWLRRVLAVQDVIYGSKYPDWLKEQLINIPTGVTKNSVWFAKTRPDDWYSEKGNFLTSESLVACPLFDTLPCRYFGQWYVLFFYPDLQRVSLEGTRYFQLQGGEPPFCVGVNGVRDPRYHCQHVNGSGEYAQMIYHYYLRTGDEEFLREFWPSAKKALEFMNSLDVDDDGLNEDHPHVFMTDNYPANVPMDQWPFFGVSSYTAGKCLAALEVGIAMARKVGDDKTADEWQKRLERGKARYDELLWNGEYYDVYYDEKTGKRNNACLSHQLSALWCVGIAGLPSPYLDKAKVDKALDSVAKINLHASPFGTVNAVYPDGTICSEGGMPDSVWSAGNFIQCNAMAAGSFLYSGHREDGITMIKDSLDTIFRGPIPLPWSQPCGLDMRSGGSCFGYDYLDHVICWTYPMLLDNQSIPEAVASGGLIRSILDAAKK